MDKHFASIALIGIIVLGALGVILGTVLIFVTKDAQAGAVCLGLGATALGALGGVVAAPKLAAASAPALPGTPADGEGGFARLPVMLMLLALLVGCTPLISNTVMQGCGQDRVSMTNKADTDQAPSTSTSAAIPVSVGASPSSSGTVTGAAAGAGK